jgi:hypothetical protein
MVRAGRRDRDPRAAGALLGQHGFLELEHLRQVQLEQAHAVRPGHPERAAVQAGSLDERTGERVVEQPGALGGAHHRHPYGRAAHVTHPTVLPPHPVPVNATASETVWHAAGK